MVDKPLYRWEARRAAKDRRERLTGGISTHDLVILAVIMSMLVIVLRFVFIFSVIQGMDIGPFTMDVQAFPPEERSPYANLTAMNDSFGHLTKISTALFIYWLLASWRSFTSKSVSLSTKLFKSTLGISIVILLAGSVFPEHAIFLADSWFEPAYTPAYKSDFVPADMNPG